MSSENNLTRTHSLIAAADRARILGQQGAVLWLTGLSGSGKSTLAYALERRLVDMGRLSFALDGDNLRLGLCSDLAFSAEDRSENIRRVGELASLLSETGMFVLTSFISPYQSDRDAVRAKVKSSFIEVFLDVSVEVCEDRDPKGLYELARAGKIKNFTGISAPYEAPTSPELRLDTGALSLEQCVDEVIGFIQGKGLFKGTDTRDQAYEGQSE